MKIIRLFIALFFCFEFVCCVTETATTTNADGSVTVTKTTHSDIPGITAISNAATPLIGLAARERTGK